MVQALDRLRDLGTVHSDRGETHVNARDGDVSEVVEQRDGKAGAIRSRNQLRHRLMPSQFTFVHLLEVQDEHLEHARRRT